MGWKVCFMCGLKCNVNLYPQPMLAVSAAAFRPIGGFCLQLALCAIIVSNAAPALTVESSSRSIAVATNLATGTSSSVAFSNLVTQAISQGTKPGTTLHEMRIEVQDRSAWESAGKETTNWFTAQVSEGDRSWTNVGVRLQGRSTRRPPGHHPSLTLKFNQSGAGEEFHGMTKFHLRNAAYNPTYLNEYMGYGVFRRAGLPAPRVEFALITVNGVSPELYVLVEGISKTFLEREFGSREGNLYEGENADVDGPLHQGNRDRQTGGQDLAPLLAALRNPALTNGLEELRKVLNVDEFARFMAVEILVGHRDGYCLQTNNYRLYHDPADDRFAFLPHGLDAILAN
ncbi:MAG: CotH kinase family protein, partial [bacterium]